MAGNKPGPAKGDPRMVECGKRGGAKVAAERGPEFYREIGRKGGQATKAMYGPEHYSRIGKIGGESLVETHGSAHMRDIASTSPAGTNREALVVKYLRACAAEGYFPTYRAIATACHCTSAGAFSVVARLAAAGRVILDPNPRKRRFVEG